MSVGGTEETSVAAVVSSNSTSGGPVYTPCDHIVVRVVSGVPDGCILKQAAVRSWNIIRLGPRILSVELHAPHPSVPCLVFAVQEEVRRHVLQDCAGY